MSSSFRPLLLLFQERFFENDSGIVDFETNIYQALGMLAVPGLLVAMFLIPHFMALSFRPPGPAVDWALRSDRLFFPAYSFSVVAYVTVFEWDMLFPDRPDFLILSAFPIRMRDLFFAKLAALGLYLAAVIVAVNGFPVLLMPIFTTYIKQASAAGVWRLALGQIAATGTAALFAFFAVSALQGILINVLEPVVFRRFQTAVQVVGMSGAVLCLLLFPVYSAAVGPIALTHPAWLHYFPPYWFVGIYDLLLPNHSPLFTDLGRFAFKALGFAIGLFCLTWGAGFSRYYRRTLESEDVPGRWRPGYSLERWIHSSEERAIFRFSGITLARNASHQLFLATYLSVGVAIGLVVSTVVSDGGISTSPNGLRAFPLIVVFFVVSGFRTAFQFPAQFPANWLFRITEAWWGEPSRRASRKRVLVSGLIPALLLFAPVEVYIWGWPLALFHFVFQLLGGAFLIEALFWNFDRVSFTCSYSPGRMNLVILAGLYLYGFTNYGFRMADLESWLDRRPFYAVLFLAIAAALLTLLWNRPGPRTNVRFETAEPEIQTLDLT